MRTAGMLFGTIAAAGIVSADAVRTPQDEGWTDQFGVDRADFRSTGRNPYFVLEPGYALVLEHGQQRLVVTVLPETKVVDGVETRIVEERESDGSNLVEVSRNYFAISSRTNAVFYFGEDVDAYKNGRIDNHEGSWLAGVNGARFGLMMPGLPLLRARYYQEIAPKVAMDRAEVLSMNGTFTSGAGKFTGVLRIEESTPLEHFSKEAKLYAPGVGLVEDGSLTLVRYGMNVAAR
ncbi:MAG TPA: hypothetical protein VE967_16055 [Gemmatimonadaceae bacterium]|nr:hypothetical protein [Gemmatimonadaceae bacterium]